MRGEEAVTCKTCKFREASDSTCHRNPPQITMYPTDNQQPIMYAVTQCWPEVKDTDWCGEHKEVPLNEQTPQYRQSR